MTNLILELAGVLSAFCGLIALTFVLAVFLSIRKLGGNLQRRHAIVLSSVILSFFLGAIILSILGSTV